MSDKDIPKIHNGEFRNNYKTFIDLLLNDCNLLSEAFSSHGGEHNDFKPLVTYYLLDYSLFFLVKYGELNIDEVDLLNDLCEIANNSKIDFDAETWRLLWNQKFADGKTFKSGDQITPQSNFENQVPGFVNLFIGIENALFDQCGRKDGISIGNYIYGAIESLGYYMICLDDYKSEIVIPLNKYIIMIYDFIKQNAKRTIICPKANYERFINSDNSERGVPSDSQENKIGQNIITNNDNLSQKEKDYRMIDDSPFQELNSLVGLDSVKKDVTRLVAFVRMQQSRKEKGLSKIPVSLHLVFSGNPGTGKTTVARILASIYKSIGILSKGHLVEVDRSSLVAGYVGQTALKTRNKIEEALGGVLFIDEAYTLAREGNDYGQEAIDTILKAMEDYRDDFIVIVAGYTDRMNMFINSNPGLKSRFTKYIEFKDYSSEQLWDIFINMCSKYNYTMTEEASKKIKRIIFSLDRTESFANAREIRNIFETIITNQALRIMNNDDTGITEIREEDLSGV